MAGTVMHLVIADRLLDKLNIVNPAYFYCGNLAPDAIMARENYEREMKRHTHFKDRTFLHEFEEPENFKAYMNRLMKFYHEYVEVEDPHHEIYLGYLTHMLVDELYLIYYRSLYVDYLISEGRDVLDMSFWDLFTHDVDCIDWELVRRYKFKYPMPDILRPGEAYEIRDYITSEEIEDSKEFIINKNFTTRHEPEELQVLDMKISMAFIERCVREIPRILVERFNMNELVKP